MPYIVKHMVIMPYGDNQCFVGEQGKPVSEKCPPDILKQLIKDDIVEMIGAPTTVMSGAEMMFTDALSSLNQKDLIQVWKLNNLKEFIMPMSDWTDEHFRQAIRSVSKVSELLLPTAVPLVDEKAPPLTVETV